MKRTSTRLLMNNSPADALSLIVTWTQDEDGHGWSGEATVWRRHERQVGDTHQVAVRQGQPLGSLSVYLDACKGGAWMFYSFEGAGISERDLQWATVFAAAAIQHKRAYMGKDKLDTL